MISTASPLTSWLAKAIRYGIVALVALILVTPATMVLAASDVPDPSEPGLSADEQLRRLLARVQYEQRNTRTLHADFRLLQQSELLLEPQESAGELFYRAPDEVRWEYSSPEPMTVLIREDRMLTWYRDLKRAERTQVGSYSERVMKYLNAANSLDALLEYFDARVSFAQLDQPYQVKLEANSPRVARRLSGMTLWIDRELFRPVKIIVESADGDVTEFQFDNFRVNAELPEGVFDIELPPDVEVRDVELGSSSSAPAVDKPAGEPASEVAPDGGLF